MALNERQADSQRLAVAVSNPTTPASGGPVRWGNRTGVALVNKAAGGNASTDTSVDFGPRVYALSVKGVDDNGSSAVAAGDMIFYVDADTPKLSKKASGYFFGFALEAVSGNATTTIKVAHVDSPGSGTLSSGGVNTTQLAAGAVTAPKLSPTLGAGHIPLPLTGMRLIASNDIAAKNATDGGLISLDTDPTLKRVNAGTDKALRIAWAATSVIEIQLGQFAYPADLDTAQPIVVNLIAGMGGSMDTPVLAVGFFGGVGDTNEGGNTASLAAAVATKTVSMATPAGTFATVTVIPAAHANDAIYLYGAYITYTRK